MLLSAGSRSLSPPRASIHLHAAKRRLPLSLSTPTHRFASMLLSCKAPAAVSLHATGVQGGDAAGAEHRRLRSRPAWVRRGRLRAAAVDLHGPAATHPRHRRDRAHSLRHQPPALLHRWGATSQRRQPGARHEVDSGDGRGIGRSLAGGLHGHLCCGVLSLRASATTTPQSR